MNKLGLLVGLVFLFLSFSSRIAGAGEVVDLYASNEDLSDYWVQKEREYEVQYPCRSAKERIPACVVVEYVISSRGKAKKISLVNTGIEKRFFHEVKKTLKRTRWIPSKSNTAKKSVKNKFIVRFSIPGEEEASCD